MNKFNDQFKFIIYCVALGISLVVYAHANFATVKQVDSIALKVEKQATKEDVFRVEIKVDSIMTHLLRKSE